MVKVRLGDGVVEGEEVEFTPTKEDWNEYHLADGSKLRFRSVVGRVVRVLGQRSPEGDPVYVVTSQNMVVVTCPSNDEVH